MRNLAKDILLTPTVHTYWSGGGVAKETLAHSIFRSDQDGQVQSLETTYRTADFSEDETVLIQSLEVFKLYYQNLDAFLAEVEKRKTPLLEKIKREFGLPEKSGEVAFISAIVKVIEQAKEDTARLFLVFIMSQNTDGAFCVFNFLEMIATDQDTQMTTPDLLLVAMIKENDEGQHLFYSLEEIDPETYSERVDEAAPIVYEVLVQAIDLHTKYYHAVVWNQTREPLIVSEGEFEVDRDDTHIKLSVFPENHSQDEKAEYITQQFEARLFNQDQQIGQLKLTQTAKYDRLEDNDLDEFAEDVSEVVNKTELIYFDAATELELEITTMFNAFESDEDKATLVVRYDGDIIQELELDITLGFQFDPEEIDSELREYLTEKRTSLQALIRKATSFLDLSLSSVEKKSMEDL